MKISGVIKNIVFENPDNGFFVFNLTTEDNILFRVTTYADSIYEGDCVFCEGEEGLYNGSPQIKNAKLSPKKPESNNEIISYLSSTRFKGIGKKMAERIVSDFGNQSIEVIQKSPEKLLAVKGVSQKVIDNIKDTFQKEIEFRSFEEFFSPYSIKLYWIKRFFDFYTFEKLENLKKNPYQIIYQFSGAIHFKTLDKIGSDNDLLNHHPERIKAGLFDFLKQETLKKGDVAIPYLLLFEHVSKILSVDPALVEEAIFVLIRENKIEESIVENDSYVYPKKLFWSEVQVANTLKRIHQAETEKISINLERIKRNMGLPLTQEQKNTLKNIPEQRVNILYGGPGTGKTTLSKGIIDIFMNDMNIKEDDIILCSPTGKASKRLSEKTGLKAQTIHKLLKYNPDNGAFVHNKDYRLKGTLFLIDEASMIDIELASDLFQSLPDECYVVIVGDPEQLPSIRPGQLLKDLIDSNLFSNHELTANKRQGRNSQIINAAYSMLENEIPIFDHALKNNDFWFINATNEEDIIKKLLLKIQGVSQRFHFDIKNDIQVLTPVKKGKLGQHNLNYELQNLINSSKEEIQYYSQGDIQRYRKNDKIIQTINNYDHDIFNGENGIISNINKGEVAINFEGQTIYYKQFELEQISLAYALTVHKSQGSEYPCVFIPIHPSISYHLYKDILYTALTRGKSHVIFIGCYETFKKCILRKRSAKRFSTLQHQLLKLI